jgi:hypothetical protein
MSIFGPCECWGGRCQASLRSYRRECTQRGSPSGKAKVRRWDVGFETGPAQAARSRIASTGDVISKVSVAPIYDSRCRESIPCRLSLDLLVGLVSRRSRWPRKLLTWDQGLHQGADPFTYVSKNAMERRIAKLK